LSRGGAVARSGTATHFGEHRLDVVAEGDVCDCERGGGCFGRPAGKSKKEAARETR